MGEKHRILSSESSNDRGDKMRATEFRCVCGFIVWLDEGKFFTTKKDGSWSGEIFRCPKCQQLLQDQLAIQKELLKIKLEKEI